jgi:hypothetical protein
MATPKKTAVGAPAKIKRKYQAKVSGVRKRKSPARKRAMMAGIDMQTILGVAIGGVASGLLDKPLSGVLSNPLLRNGAKVALGVFLSTKKGLIQGVGYGMVAGGGMGIASGLMGGSMSGLPALISGNVPALISDEFGNYVENALAQIEDEEEQEDNEEEVEDLGYAVPALAGMFDDNTLMGL